MPGRNSRKRPSKNGTIWGSRRHRVLCSEEAAAARKEERRGKGWYIVAENPTTRFQNANLARLGAQKKGGIVLPMEAE